MMTVKALVDFLTRGNTLRGPRLVQMRYDPNVSWHHIAYVEDEEHLEELCGTPTGQ